jgi:hypothetical protein
MVRQSKRLDAEHGVAMTEFALVLPVFVLVVAGLLGFGRALFYWIEANHLANETVRWAVVDQRPDPTKTLQEYARDSGGTVEFSDARVCILVPGTDDGSGGFQPPTPPQVGGPLEVKISKPFSFVPLLDIGTITIRGSATMRVERFANGTQPASYTVGSPFGPCT